MKKIFLPLVVSVIIGYIFSCLMFKQYNYSSAVSSNETYKLFFIQQGVYSTYDSMIENTNLIENYIYIEEKKQFKVYIGVTKKEENIPILQEYFKNIGLNTIVKEYNINNSGFIEKLKNYDDKLSSSSNNLEKSKIIEDVLKTYKESSDNK